MRDREAQIVTRQRASACRTLSESLLLAVQRSKYAALVSPGLAPDFSMWYKMKKIYAQII
jgi:hypothetical protein